MNAQLLAALAVFSPFLAGQAPWYPGGKAPADSPVRIKEWKVDYEVGYHVLRGEECEGPDAHGSYQKLHFNSDFTVAGSLILEGPVPVVPTFRKGERAPHDPLEVLRTLKRGVAWQAKPVEKPEAKTTIPFDRHRRDVDFHAYSWKSLKHVEKPAEGCDSVWSDLEVERTVNGKGTASLVVHGSLSIDLENRWYKVEVSLSDDRRQMPLRVVTSRRYESGDHNGPNPPEHEKGEGGVPMDELLGRCASDTLKFGKVVVREGRLPEGLPESFSFEVTEPMTAISPELCPVVRQEPGEWLKKNAHRTQVVVKVTITRTR